MCQSFRSPRVTRPGMTDPCVTNTFRSILLKMQGSLRLLQLWHGLEPEHLVFCLWHRTQLSRESLAISHPILPCLPLTHFWIAFLVFQRLPLGLLVNCDCRWSGCADELEEMRGGCPGEIGAYLGQSGRGEPDSCDSYLLCWTPPDPFRFEQDSTWTVTPT